MAAADEKIGEEETRQSAVPEAAPFDINDFKIVKEGEAEILMHAKNEVFFNKAQVFFFFFWQKHVLISLVSTF